MIDDLGASAVGHQLALDLAEMEQPQ